jgi:hypothetical protein
MIWECVGMAAFGHFSFGLSQFHGHGLWLVCEVARGPMCIWHLYEGHLSLLHGPWWQNLPE